MAEIAKHKNMNRIVILNVIGTVTYQALNFLLTPILTRALGTYDFGMVTLYISWVNILLPVLSLNADSVIALVAVHIDESERNRYNTSLVGLELVSYSIIASFVILFFGPICRAMQFPPIVVVLLMIQCFGQMLVQFMINYYIQYQRTVLQFCFSIGVSVATFLSTLGLLKVIADPSMKYLCRILGFAAPYLVGGILALLILYRLHSKWFCLDVWKYALPVCVPFIMHSLSHMALTQSGKLILQNVVPDGVSVVGYYGFAYTIASIMQVVWTALNNAWVPYYFQLLSKGEYQQIRDSEKRYMFLYTGGFSAFCLLSPELIQIMGGTRYAGAGKLVLLLLAGIYMIYLYSFPVNFKMYKKSTKSIAFGTICAAFVNITLGLLLAPQLSYWGCAIAMAASYLVLFLIHQTTVKDPDHEYFCSNSFFLAGFGVAIAAIVISWLLEKLLVIRWVAAACICLVLLSRLIRQKRIF